MESQHKSAILLQIRFDANESTLHGAAESECGLLPTVGHGWYRPYPDLCRSLEKNHPQDVAGGLSDQSIPQQMVSFLHFTVWQPFR